MDDPLKSIRGTHTIKRGQVVERPKPVAILDSNLRYARLVRYANEAIRVFVLGTKGSQPAWFLDTEHPDDCLGIDEARVRAYGLDRLIRRVKGEPVVDAPPPPAVAGVATPPGERDR